MEVVSVNSVPAAISSRATPQPDTGAACSTANTESPPGPIDTAAVPNFASGANTRILPVARSNAGVETVRSKHSGDAR